MGESDYRRGSLHYSEENVLHESALNRNSIGKSTISNIVVSDGFIKRDELDCKRII
jgi:hypothetical protein